MGKNDIEKSGGIKEEVVEKEINRDEKVTSGQDKSNEEKINIKYIDETEVNSKSNKKSKIKNIIITMLILVVITILGVGTYYGVKITKLVKNYDNKVYPGAFVLNKDISGMTKEELHTTLEGILNDIENKDIKVTIADRSFEIARRALDVKIDYDSIENEALSYGKDNKFFDRLDMINEYSNRNYEIKLSYSEDAIKEFVDKIANEVYVEPKDASIYIAGGAINVTDGQVGSELNSEKLTSEIKAVVEDIGGDDKVTLAAELKDVNPNITTEALNSVNGIIASYTTTFQPGPSGTNIGIGASHIDNSLLMPGEVFSTIDGLGPTTPENGFVKANTYVDGKVVPGYGGGVCQIATTLYNAELRAGIVPLERQCHMMTVGYVPLGLDATVGDYAPDLKFENPYEYPIVIKSYTNGGSLVVELWSNTNATNGIRYEPKAFAKGLYAETYLYGYDSNGNVISEEFLNTSTYKPFS